MNSVPKTESMKSLVISAVWIGFAVGLVASSTNIAMSNMMEQGGESQVLEESQAGTVMVHEATTVPGVDEGILEVTIVRP